MAETSGKCLRGGFNIWTVLTAPVKLALIVIVIVGLVAISVYSEMYFTTDEFCRFEDEPTLLNLFNLPKLFKGEHLAAFTCTGPVFADKDGYTVVDLHINSNFEEPVYVKNVLCTNVAKDKVNTNHTNGFGQPIRIEPKRVGLSFSGANRLACVDEKGNWLQLSQEYLLETKVKTNLRFRGTIVMWYNLESDPKEMAPRVAFATLVDKGVVQHYISYTEE